MGGKIEFPSLSKTRMILAGARAFASVSHGSTIARSIVGDLDRSRDEILQRANLCLSLSACPFFFLLFRRENSRLEEKQKLKMG